MAKLDREAGNSSHPSPDPEIAAQPASAVGVFWAVRAPAGFTTLLVHRCLLADAEPYGDRRTCLHGHYELWEQWRKGSEEVPAELSGLVAGSEYEEWPRGRVVFDAVRCEFTCYADNQILRRADLVAAIRIRFGLPGGRTKFKWDNHYRSTMLLKG